MALVFQKITDKGIETIDKVQLAINRLVCFSDALKGKGDKYYVADSGGKDSSVIKKICELAKVPFEIVHNHTTCDHPETVYFVRRERDYWRTKGIEYTITYPKDKNGNFISMWSLIPQKYLPTRLHRWCCEILKENGGINRIVVTGVRSEESAKRKGRGTYETIAKSNPKQNKVIRNNDNDFRMQLEICPSYKKIVVNPIIDWTAADVWEFIRKYKINYNPLYDQGYKRVGCVGCPMSHKQKQELEKNPQFKKMYLTAIRKMLEQKPHLKDKYGWRDENACYEWWVENKPIPYDTGQLSFDVA